MPSDPEGPNGAKTLTERILYRAFGLPTGPLGRIGGWILAGGKDEMIEWMIELLSVQPTDRVVEVGFGPGDGVRLAAETASDGFVAGVDYSELMVRKARERNAAAIEAGTVDLRYGRASDLPFEADSFEKAFSINSMQLWPDVQAGLEELQRVLTPDGTAAFGATPHAKHSPEDLTRILSSAGFEAVRIHERDRGICAIVENG